MGQKVNPHGLRVGVISDWDSNWFAEEKFADYLVEDYKIREFVKKKLYSAGISKIEIERPTDKVRVIIHTAKPGFVIGKGGEEIEKLKKELAKVIARKTALDIKIMDVKNPDKHAQLVAENIAAQLENRVSFRRAMKSAMGRTLNLFQDVLVELIWLVQSSTAKVLFHFRLCVQILIMVSQRLTQLMVKLVLRYGSTMVKYFQQRTMPKRKGAINNVNA